MNSREKKRNELQGSKEKRRCVMRRREKTREEER